MQYSNDQIWNNKQIKKFHKVLEEQFGFKKKLDYTFISRKGKIYIISKKINEFPINYFHTKGLYIAKEEASGIRLSIEGSQLIGPNCTKNILILDNFNEWMEGKDISTNNIFKNMVIIKYKNDFLGCGIYKNNTILNFVPKSRRIH